MSAPGRIAELIVQAAPIRTVRSCEVVRDFLAADLVRYDDEGETWRVRHWSWFYDGWVWTDVREPISVFPTPPREGGSA